MKGMEIIEGALDTLYFFYFPANESGCFLAENILHPSKFQLAGVRPFGGIREQTSKQTDRLALLQSDFKSFECKLLSFKLLPQMKPRLVFS